MEGIANTDQKLVETVRDYAITEGLPATFELVQAFLTFRAQLREIGPRYVKEVDPNLVNEKKPEPMKAKKKEEDDYKVGTAPDPIPPLEAAEKLSRHEAADQSMELPR
jgi:hypothetical protein